ncbi:MAG: cell division ATP-binding protein FtsE [Porticoccaceae bacterium]|nr:MAG: cell division ATP-binding protein FtsE [Porticoccaceae bacterium]
MIRFEHVTLRYPSGQEALRDLSFALEEGEFAFLTGHSGAGKSTLLKLILLLERPTRGRVLVKGKDLAALDRRQVPFFRRRVGVVFQDPHLLLDRTVFENVALPLEVMGFPRADIPRRVRAALDKVGLLDKERAWPGHLSAGEQQRVGIARAVVHKPRLLLADEPTGNLDPELSAEIMALFRLFNEVGVTVLVATHDVELIAPFHCRRLHLRQGRLAEPPP